MGVDKDRLVLLIGEMERAVTLLKEYRNIPEAAFVADLKSLGAAKYYFMVAIEACVAICNHITAKEHTGVPETYADCFRILRDTRIVSPELSDKLIAMAKFRNLLVHLYWKVDNERVHRILCSELDDFHEFTRSIAGAYL